MVWQGDRKGCLVTTAVHLWVRLATRRMGVVSRASDKVIVGGMAVSRRASIDLPARRSHSTAAIAIP
jgi:hypothetical protein